MQASGGTVILWFEDVYDLKRDSSNHTFSYGDNSITLEGVERLRMLSGKEELASFVTFNDLGDEALVD